MKTTFNMENIESEMRRLKKVLEHLNQAMDLCDDGVIVNYEWHDIYPIKQSVEQRIDELNTFCKIVYVRYPEYFTEVEDEEDDEITWEEIDEWLNDRDFEEEEEA